MRNMPASLLLLAAFGSPTVATASERPPAWTFEIRRDASIDTSVTVTNRCRQSHRFALTTDEPGMVDFPGSTEVELGAAASETVPVRFSAAGLAPGTYGGEVIVKCRDCKREPGCSQDREVFLARMTVRAGEESQARPTSDPEALRPRAPFEQPKGNEVTRVVGLGCLLRGSEGGCRTPGWGCLVMFPESSLQASLRPFPDTPVDLRGEAQVVPGDRPRLAYTLTAPAADGLTEIPVARAVPLTKVVSALLGFERVVILPGRYRVDRSAGPHGRVSFEIETRGAQNDRMVHEHYVRRHEGLPIANPSNPYDFVGVYHNAGLDYVLDGISTDCGGRDVDALDSRVREFAARIASLRGEPAVRDQAWLGAALAADELAQTAAGEPPGADSGEAADRILEASRSRLSPRGYAPLVDAWRGVGGLLDRAQRGEIDHQGFQQGVAEIEADLARRARPSDPTFAPAWIVLATARYSALRAFEQGSQGGEPAARIKWWNVAKQDLIGALAGAAFGPWGSVGGGVVFSAAEIETQLSEE